MRSPFFTKIYVYWIKITRFFNQFKNYIKYNVWMTDGKYELYQVYIDIFGTIQELEHEYKLLEREYENFPDKRVSDAVAVRKRMQSIAEIELPMLDAKEHKIRERMKYLV